MYNYIKGKVVYIDSNTITVDNNGIGYLIYTPNPYSFELEKDYTVYTYQSVKEDDISLYGFKSLEEKLFFLKLISVNGLGPKTALPMIATGSINGIADAINRENVLYLKKFPKIGDKLAKQIILDLKGKVESEEVIGEVSSTDELREVLLGLGYKDKDIKGIIIKVDRSNTIENQIKEALRLLVR